MNRSGAGLDLDFSPIVQRHRHSIKHQEHYPSSCLYRSKSKSIIPPTPFQRKRVPRTSFTTQKTKRRLLFSTKTCKMNRSHSKSPSKKHKLWKCAKNTPTGSPMRKKLLFMKKKNMQRVCLSAGRSRGPAFYQNTGLIGSGSFSLVYRVIQESTKKIYAIKQSKIPVRSRTDAEQALREVNILNRIHCSYKQGLHQWKKNIVNLHQYWFSMDNHLCQLYDFYSSGNLKELIEFNSQLNPLQILKIMKQLSGGLSLIHSLNICHCDIKPENIFIDQGFRLKIGDFGISIIANDASNQKLSLFEHCGDSIYAAPEMLSSFDDISVVTTKCDIYSLGVLFLELILDICVPSRGPIHKHLRSGNVDFDWLSSQQMDFFDNSASATNNTSDVSVSDDSSIDGSVGGGEPIATNQEVGKAEMKNLCKKMLNPKPELRPTAAQIVDSIASILNNYQSVMKNMKGFKHFNVPISLLNGGSMQMQNSNNNNALDLTDMSVQSECVVGHAINNKKKVWFYRTSIRSFEQTYDPTPFNQINVSPNKKNLKLMKQENSMFFPSMSLSPLQTDNEDTTNDSGFEMKFQSVDSEEDNDVAPLRLF